MLGDRVWMLAGDQTALKKRDRPLLLIEVTDAFLRNLDNSADELVGTLQMLDYKLFLVAHTWLL
jgi:hypothetical protein